MKKEKADKAQEKETDQRKQAIDAALGQIEKQFGKGSIMRLGADTRMAEMNVVSTGSLDLDIALGIGGFPSGRIVEIYGPESSGKTTLTLSAIAETQKKEALLPSLMRNML